MKRPHAVISMSDLQEKGPSSIYFVHRIILSNQSQCEPPHTDSSCPGACPGPGKTTGKMWLHNMLFKGWAPGPFTRHRFRPWAAGLGCTSLLPQGGLREHVVEGPFSSGKF